MYILGRMKSEYPWRQPIHSQNVRRLYDSITNEIKMQVSNPYIASTLLNWDVDIQNEFESLPHHIELHRSTNTIFKEGEFGVYIAEVKVERRKDQLIVEPKVDTNNFIYYYFHIKRKL